MFATQARSEEETFLSSTQARRLAPWDAHLCDCVSSALTHVVQGSNYQAWDRDFTHRHVASCRALGATIRASLPHVPRAPRHAPLIGAMALTDRSAMAQPQEDAKLPRYFGPCLTEFGPARANFDQVCPGMDNIELNSICFGPNSTNFGPQSTRCGPSAANFDQDWRAIGQNYPCFGRNRPTAARSRPRSY